MGVAGVLAALHCRHLILHTRESVGVLGVLVSTSTLQSSDCTYIRECGSIRGISQYHYIAVIWQDVDEIVEIQFVPLAYNSII